MSEQQEAAWRQAGIIDRSLLAQSHGGPPALTNITADFLRSEVPTLSEGDINTLMQFYTSLTDDDFTQNDRGVQIPHYQKKRFERYMSSLLIGRWPGVELFMRNVGQSPYDTGIGQRVKQIFENIAASPGQACSICLEPTIRCASRELRVDIDEYERFFFNRFHDTLHIKLRDALEGSDIEYPIPFRRFTARQIAEIMTEALTSPPVPSSASPASPVSAASSARAVNVVNSSACGGGSCFGWWKSPKVAPIPPMTQPPISLYKDLLSRCVRNLIRVFPKDVATQKAIEVLRNTCSSPIIREGGINYQAVKAQTLEQGNDNTKTVIIRPCGHRFHGRCLNAHIAAGRMFCPNCRGALNRPQYGGRRKTRAKKAKKSSRKRTRRS